MRQVLYRVAASLDGYIAGPHGEVDWIVHDPAVDLAGVYDSVDTVLLGRRTWQLTRQPGAPLLGGGIPLLESGSPPTRLLLEDVQRFPTGILGLRYRVPAAEFVTRS